ncbi:OmpW/AlkL family protein [Paraglaciecola marina]|uniref:OmpW/AlkL family protein n=1 Tax=Paraglaciecola marina TaxID=2500157 RepID=UPI001061FF85|nr:OmpW family outer membrane protein [Paraglaciecola marina]
MKKSHIAIALTGILFCAAQPAYSYEKGDWLIRAGATSVSPHDSSSNVNVAGADLGVGVNVDSNTQLGLNILYFYTPKLALELLAATPFSHDIGLDTVGGLGSTKHLPPTLSVNYYFADPSAKFQPYAGVGLNYTIFFDEDFTAANTEAGFSDLELDDSVGLAAQIGFDYAIDDKWSINTSVRWIDIDTEATFDLNGATGSVDVDIDPLVYSVMLGYRF